MGRATPPGNGDRVFGGLLKSPLQKQLLTSVGANGHLLRITIVNAPTDF
ncbi:MAG: hypothetical protein F6K39_41600 [Okeania sp. SIO3B3]|nr:hypothetical protein [Okeania sp. SIO3B3]